MYGWLIDLKAEAGKEVHKRDCKGYLLIRI